MKCHIRIMILLKEKNYTKKVSINRHPCVGNQNQKPYNYTDRQITQKIHSLWIMCKSNWLFCGFCVRDRFFWQTDNKGKGTALYTKSQATSAIPINQRRKWPLSGGALSRNFFTSPKNIMCFEASRLLMGNLLCLKISFIMYQCYN